MKKNPIMGLKSVPSLPRAIYTRETVNAVEGIEHFPHKCHPELNFYTQIESLTKPSTFAVETVTYPKCKGDGHLLLYSWMPFPFSFTPFTSYFTNWL